MRHKNSLPYHINRVIVFISIIIFNVCYCLLNAYPVTGISNLHTMLSTTLWDGLYDLCLHYQQCDLLGPWFLYPLMGEWCLCKLRFPKVQTHTDVREQNQRFVTVLLWANWVCAWKILNGVGHFQWRLTLPTASKWLQWSLDVEKRSLNTQTRTWVAVQLLHLRETLNEALNLSEISQETD